MTDDNRISLTFEEAARYLRGRMAPCEDFNNRIARYRRRPEGMGGVAL